VGREYLLIFNHLSEVALALAKFHSERKIVKDDMPTPILSHFVVGKGLKKSLQQQVVSGHQHRYDNGMIPPVEDSLPRVERYSGLEPTILCVSKGGVT
jgi:hypothetical protein